MSSIAPNVVIGKAKVDDNFLMSHITRVTIFVNIDYLVVELLA